METLNELNKKYKTVLDSLKNKKKKNEVVVDDNVDSDSIDSFIDDIDPLGLGYVFAIANSEYGYSSESSDED